MSPVDTCKMDQGWDDHSIHASKRDNNSSGQHVRLGDVGDGLDRGGNMKVNKDAANSFEGEREAAKLFLPTVRLKRKYR
jgi:hypothetical protein